MRIARGEIITKILDYLRDYYDDHGYMPTLDEIALACGGRSKQWAWYYLRELARLKLIKLTPGKHRGIIIK